MRLIDADALLEKWENGKKFEYDSKIQEKEYVTLGANAAIDTFVDSVKQAPSVDAEPVVHSQWIICCDESEDFMVGEDGDTFYIECSKCGKKIYDVDQAAAYHEDFKKIQEDYPYCNCGARMDGE